MFDGLSAGFTNGNAPILGNQLFENIFESPANGLMLLDNEFHILRMGKGLCQLLGYEQHELFGKFVTQIVAAEDWEIAGQKLQSLGPSDEIAYAAESRYQHKDGSVVWVIVSVSALPNCSGKGMPAFAIQVTSIDKQKLAEQSEQDAMTRWNFALQSAGQGVWDCDVVSDTWTYSVTWKRMRGIDVNEELNLDDEHWLKEIHPDDHALVREKMDERFNPGMGEVSYEYRQWHRQGYWMWILARGRCIEFLPDGRPKRIIGTDTDITELKSNEENLRKFSELEMRWKIAVESAEEGLWDHNEVTGERFHSAAWCKMRGYAEHELYTHSEENWLDRIHPEDAGRVKETINGLDLSENDQLSIEYREKHQKGHWVSIFSRGRVLGRNATGLPLRVIGTDTDVTNIRKRELELAQLSHRLELALTTSRVGIWKSDVINSQTYWDQRSCEMFGIEFSTGPIPKDTWERMVHPDDFEYTNFVCKSSIAKRQDFSLDYRIILDSGRVRHIRCRATFPALDTDHSSVTGVMWDVTEDIEKAEAFRSAKMLAENRSRDLEVARIHLEHASLHDSLTGLPNRRHLDNMLQKFQDGSKQGQSMTLLHIDLDRFKQINDTKGHAAGDAVLVHTAMLLRTQFRESDLVARIGGDEFVVLLSPSPDRRILQKMLDRVIHVSIQPIEWQNQECRCGVSIGVAESAGDIDPKQLLVNADIALYRAKRSGRNCAVNFTGSLQAEIVANKQCADDLFNALERNEFVPFYQPIFHAKSREVAGLEALVRWNHPTRGLLTPDKFLNVAAELNAMSAIDRTILEQALSHLDIWDADGVGIPKISVNVSARRLSSDALLDSLRSLNIQPGRVSFELLESIFLDDGNDLNTANIEAVKNLGIGIDIDDFGTGHASIVSLLRLNPNRMKIDRQLTLNIVESEAQRRLVRSLIEIGKSQNIEVCAEGVETADHANILTSLGCDYLQGYYFAKPMAFSEISKFMERADWRNSPIEIDQDDLTARKLARFMQRIGFSKARKFA